MASRIFSSEQKAKLTQLFNEAVGIMQEVEDLNAGLSDTIKSYAEELEIKPSILKKAIKTAQKTNFTNVKSDYEDLETILETVGRTL